MLSGEWLKEHDAHERGNAAARPPIVLIGTTATTVRRLKLLVHSMAPLATGVCGLKLDGLRHGGNAASL